MISLYSKNLENAVNEISKLPGIGKRSALRLALHLIKQDEANVTLLTRSEEHTSELQSLYYIS